MRVVLQRVQRASVRVGDELVGSIGPGILALVGVAADDGDEDARWLAEKTVHLRIFPGPQGKMHHSLLETGGQLLAVSQFTLYGDARKGRRPDFTRAAPPAVAEPLFERYVHYVRQLGVPVETGRFGAMMAVELVNDGPVTLIVDSPRKAPAADIPV